MSAPELIDPCSQFALLTDKQAVGEVLTPEESRWILDHARTCLACGTEMAIYAAMPRLVGATRVSSSRGSHHPRTYRAPSRHAESRKRGSLHDTPVQRSANDYGCTPNRIQCAAVPGAVAGIPTGVAVRRAGPIGATCGTADAMLRPVAPKSPERPIVTHGRGSGRGLKVWILAAAVITLGGVAAAQFVSIRPPKAPPPAASSEPTFVQEPANVGAPSHRTAENAGPTLPSTPAVVESAPSTTAPMTVPTPTGRHTASVGGSQAKAAQVAAVPEPVEPQASIEDLLRDARSLRAKGRPSEAAAAYQRLIRDYPRSAEARTARVSVGELQLGHLGDPAGALASFDAYLQGGPGALTLEARHGRIRALTALGRTAEEQREIAKFVKDYPASPQAAVLSARLTPSTR